METDDWLVIELAYNFEYLDFAIIDQIGKHVYILKIKHMKIDQNQG